MSDRTSRSLGFGLAAIASAGVMALTAMVNPPVATADGDDIGVVIGASGLPLPTAMQPEYVPAADAQYLDNQFMATPLYPDLTFFQATSTDPDNPGFYGPGVPTPEGLYPLTGAGVHQLYLNYPTDADGFPDQSSSVGQGMTILENAI